LRGFLVEVYRVALSRFSESNIDFLVLVASAS